MPTRLTRGQYQELSCLARMATAERRHSDQEASMTEGATSALLKYFESKGIPFIGDPYIEFADLPTGPALVRSTSWFGLMRFVRITTDGGRWFVQWWTVRGLDVSTVDPDAVIAVLEDAVTGNSGSTWHQERLVAHRLAMAGYVLTAAQQDILNHLGPEWTAEVIEDFDKWGVVDAEGNWFYETSAWNGRVGTDSPSGEVYFYHRKKTLDKEPEEAYDL